MSIITVTLIEGLLTTAQKRELAANLTDAVVRVEGEAMRAATWCIIDEVKNGHWMIGGQPLTRREVRSIVGPQSLLVGSSLLASPGCRR
jgi:4-oxalocrotonate tautomerase